MTKEEIISMAREAGIAYTNRVHPQVTEYATSEESISRFAALVEAAHTAKLLAGVEMPEPVGSAEVFSGNNEHGLPEYAYVDVYTDDQMREYAAGLVAKKDAEIAHIKEVEFPKRLGNVTKPLIAERDALKSEVERLTAAVSEPLTDEQAMDAYCETPPFSTFKDAFVAGIRSAEAAHNIRSK